MDNGHGAEITIPCSKMWFGASARILGRPKISSTDAGNGKGLRGPVWPGGGAVLSQVIRSGIESCSSVNLSDKLPSLLVLLLEIDAALPLDSGSTSAIDLLGFNFDCLEKVCNCHGLSNQSGKASCEMEIGCDILSWNNKFDLRSKHACCGNVNL